MDEPPSSSGPVLAGELFPPEFNGASAREATLDDAPEMLRVLTAAFPRWPPQEIDVDALDHLRWKMETSDGETISPHDVVVADGEIAGVMLAWVGRARIGKEVLVTDRAVDLAVHPDHQGKRFGRLINRPSEVRNVHREDYFSFDTRPHSPATLHMHSGDTVARGMRVWTRPLGLAASARSLRRAPGRRVARTSLANRLTRRHQALRTAAESIAVEPVAQFDERADRLWERTSAGFDIVRVRDARVLNWRYLDPRAGRIVTLGAYEGDQLLAYLAYRRPAAGVAALLDVFSEPDRPEAITALVRHALRLLQADGATRIDAWLAPDHPYEPAFEAGGLTDSGVVTTVEFGTKPIRQSTEALDVLVNPATRLHVTMGDFDWV